MFKTNNKHAIEIPMGSVGKLQKIGIGKMRGSAYIDFAELGMQWVKPKGWCNMIVKVIQGV